MQNTLYTCHDNPITVAVSNVRPSKIVVTIDSGAVLKKDNDRLGHYIIYTEKKGSLTVYVSKKTWRGLKSIYSTTFRVRRFSTLFSTLSISLNGKQRGKMAKSLLCNAIAPVTYYPNIDVEVRIPIKEYTVNIYRNANQIFTRKLGEEEGRIDSVTNDFFTTLENGDSVVFNNFIVKDCSGEMDDLNSIQFTITEAENYHKPPPHKPGDTEEIIDPVTGESHIKKW